MIQFILYFTEEIAQWLWWITKLQLKTELLMDAMLSLQSRGKLKLLLSLPEQKQSERRIERVCSSLGHRTDVSHHRESISKEGKWDASCTLCDFLGIWVYFLVQGWYQNGFYFRSKAKTDALWVYKVFSFLAEQLQALRHNLRSSQVKYNKYVCFYEEVKRTATKHGSDSASCPRTLQHDRCFQAGVSTCRSLLYISAVWFLAVGRNSLGHILIKLSLTPGMSSGQRCQLSAYSECKRRA